MDNRRWGVRSIAVGGCDLSWINWRIHRVFNRPGLFLTLSWDFFAGDRLRTWSGESFANGGGVRFIAMVMPGRYDERDRSPKGGDSERSSMGSTIARPRPCQGEPKPSSKSAAANS